MKLSATRTTVLALLGAEAALAAPVDTDGITNAPTATVVARQVAVSTSQITNVPLSELNILNSMIASAISSGVEEAMLATASVHSAECNNHGICTDPLTKRAPLPTVTATKPTEVPATITARDFTPTIVPPATCTTADGSAFIYPTECQPNVVGGMAAECSYYAGAVVPADGGWADGGWHAIRPTSVIVPIASGINKRFETVTIPAEPKKEEAKTEEKHKESEHKEIDVEKRQGGNKCGTFYCT